MTMSEKRGNGASAPAHIVLHEREEWKGEDSSDTIAWRATSNTFAPCGQCIQEVKKIQLKCQSQK
jgi:hypothetical protein